MMAEKGCTYRNPLLRDGVSQSGRVPDALDTDYVRVDERSLAGLLRRVIGLSEELEYYRLDNTVSGDWRSFFDGDVTSIIALLTAEETESWRESLREIEERIHDDATHYTELRKAYKVNFDIIATLARWIDTRYADLPEGFGIQEQLRQSVTATLRGELRKAAAYYKAAGPGGEGVLDPGYRDDGTYCSRELSDFDSLGEEGLDDIWIAPGAGASGWKAYWEAIAPDNTIYLADGTTIADRLRAAYPAAAGLTSSFINAIRKCREKAPGFIEETLENYSSHKPQMGLLLAFLQLFRHAQERINTLGSRHLNFHFEDVLRLERREAVPDRVHLIGKLAKHADRCRLEKGTLFKAGTDAAGREVLYRTPREVVLNRARVAALKSVYVDKSRRYQVYDKPVANSADGVGGELENPSAGWKAFGETQVVGEGDEAAYLENLPGRVASMRLSEVGFALSAPVLSLAEGRRSLSVKLRCDSLPRESDMPGGRIFNCYLTGGEEWLDVRKLEGGEISLSSGGEPDELLLEITLPESAPPVRPWTAEAHGGNYKTPWPVLKVTLNREIGPEAYGYKPLKDVNVREAEITVDVTGLKDLVLQNELGLLDPTKPFQPFGMEPSVGSAFYIGSREIFSKRLSSLNLRIAWHKLPPSFQYHYADYSPEFNPALEQFKAKLEVLKGGSWQPSANNEKSYRPLFESLLESPRDFALRSGDIKLRPGDIPPQKIPLPPFTGARGGVPSAEPPSVIAGRTEIRFTRDDSAIGMSAEPGLEEFARLGVSQKRGFVRLILKEPPKAFGHKLYPRLLTQRVTAEGNPDLPKEPYTPVIKSLEVDYTAAETVRPNNAAGFEDRVGRFYHIRPFGEEEVHEGREASPESTLLPRFRNGEWHEGEFFVGLSELDPPQQLSLLFRVAEGSADPALPRQQVDWFYLSNEGWKRFEEREIVHESTNGLLTTGIIRFNMPDDITAQSPRFPGSLHWIKAAVAKHSEAVCRLVDVHAQAFTAEFADRGNDPGFLSHSLPAGTISKPKASRSELKSVEQPYASEGGRVREEDPEFHRRASERLRHKERGIAIWDYERLVLQHFPEVYKAKCVNHSTYDYPRNGGTFSAEFAPGYVSVVVVPDLRNKNAVEPLKPRLSQNKRDEIKKFLSRKISPFAARKLKVVNALFEQVRLRFKVRFFDDVDAGFYQRKLNEELKRFLSPWAFEEGRDITFGGSIHRSVILNFVEERPYVDYLTDFRMDHRLDGGDGEEDVEQIAVTTARSVLVSHESHDITAIGAGE